MGTPNNMLQLALPEKLTPSVEGINGSPKATPQSLPAAASASTPATDKGVWPDSANSKGPNLWSDHSLKGQALDSASARAAAASSSLSAGKRRLEQARAELEQARLVALPKYQGLGLGPTKLSVARVALLPLLPFLLLV